MNKTKKLLANLGPDVENVDILRIVNKDGDLHHFYDHIVDGGEVQFLAVPEKKFKDINFGSSASAYRIKPKTRKAFMIGDVEITNGPYQTDVDCPLLGQSIVSFLFKNRQDCISFSNEIGWREVDIDE